MWRWSPRRRTWPSPALTSSLAKQGCEFVFVGPLLDGSTQVCPNCAAFRKQAPPLDSERQLGVGGEEEEKEEEEEKMSLLSNVRLVKRRGARVVSLGTVITSDAPERGWNYRPSWRSARSLWKVIR
mmetsp:Transcript_19157/g.53416  ORF Transcript_19157/g.53416 Transcript_19157/m.53416 type:complete len:126 (+) Transcript_19157:122-499(+)